MRNVTYHGFGRRQSDGKPVFVYEAEMRDGRDLDGKFDIQFAAIEVDDGAEFAVLDRQGKLLGGYPLSEEIEALLDDLIGSGEFLAAVNYDNLGWEEITGAHAYPILPGLGTEFDIVQEIDLGAQDREQLREIRRVLRSRTNTEVED